MTPAAGSRQKDLIGGAVVMAIGLGAVQLGRGYPMGTLTRMGPGFFPVMLGVIMALTGAVMGGAALLAAPDGPRKVVGPSWRGWACILAAVAAFAVLGTHAGLVAATFAIVFVSALGHRKNGLRDALLLAVSMVVFCVVVFAWLLRIPFPLFGSAG